VTALFFERRSTNPVEEEPLMGRVRDKLLPLGLGLAGLLFMRAALAKCASEAAG
jgi:hypothetical protein